MKIKLAICLNDDIYQERFVRCVMRHYAQAYEFHVFKDMSEVLEEGIHQYDGFVLEDCNLKELGWEEDGIKKALLLKEEDKYQEVYKIMEALEQLLSDQGMSLSIRKKTNQKVFGVYSPSVPSLQLPFSMVLNEILGEEKKTIFGDLQEHSGFDQEGELGLEDMMTMATKKNFVRSRLQAAIGHMQQWDYIFPVKNTRCLLEGKKELFQDLKEQLISEWGYEVMVLNLGEIAMNLEGVSNLCDQIFVLYPKGNVGEWREKQFIQELERKGEQDVLHRVQRMEIPTVSSADGDWRKIAEKWKWGSLGNMLRKIIWEEESFG